MRRTLWDELQRASSFSSSGMAWTGIDRRNRMCSAGGPSSKGPTSLLTAVTAAATASCSSSSFATATVCMLMRVRVRARVSMIDEGEGNLRSEDDDETPARDRADRRAKSEAVIVNCAQCQGTAAQPSQ